MTAAALQTNPDAPPYFNVAPKKRGISPKYGNSWLAFLQISFLPPAGGRIGREINDKIRYWGQGADEAATTRLIKSQ
ncbi:hypothetical protein DDT54_07330 [Brenneria nigrifluens DSM 30175 = ATCC 13028]|uniref:Uncharacterized protein n=1 Tax=Brenneria nigrifluens DSM 30175 = ATCC 13028 TaxID=1121120 RepID=A0A2U1USW6_9GAMM|nr:hypothetical protein DDT54_07330 [Brenneria nigrifluens DSM 30175 = ATCC 13028]